MFLALRPGRAARGRHRSCCRAALPRLPPARPFWGGAGRAVAGEPCRLRRGPPLGRPTGLTRCAHTTAVFSVVRAACARQHARGTPEPPHAFSNSRGEPRRPAGAGVSGGHGGCELRTKFLARAAAAVPAPAHPLPRAAVRCQGCRWRLLGVHDACTAGAVAVPALHCWASCVKIEMEVAL